MTYKELLCVLANMTDEQLNQEAFIVGEESCGMTARGISGFDTTQPGDEIVQENLIDAGYPVLNLYNDEDED